MNTEQKLNILADSSKFDLACTCKMKAESGRVRGSEGRWIYPAVLPNGRKTFLLKTLQSNACVNDCSYCPFSQQRDLQRCILGPDELADGFIKLLDARRVEGLFLSSGVLGSPEKTMEQMLATVELLRKKHQFRGFIHLKVIPGASQAAIEQAVRLATRVSVNIETPNAERLGRLSKKKRFHEDIISAIKTISRLRQQINPRCKQTTQFVVGAAEESDREIVLATDRLYQKFDMERIYFSAYQDFDVEAPVAQRMLFDDLPAEKMPANSDSFIREHRLYQVDFLLRKYGFSRDDIYFDQQGNLSLQQDPKMIWANKHPELFPVDVNRADREQLLRVPGIGPIGVKKILTHRRHHRFRYLDELRQLGIRTRNTQPYLSLVR